MSNNTRSEKVDLVGPIIATVLASIIVALAAAGEAPKQTQTPLEALVRAEATSKRSDMP